MTNSPSHVLHGVKSGVSPRAGNLARLEPGSPGHFLFEPFKQLVAHGSNPNEAAALSLTAASGAGAAIDRRCYPAESRPSPFTQVDYLTHRGGSIGFSSRKQKPTRSAFHEVGIFFHDRAG